MAGSGQIINLVIIAAIAFVGYKFYKSGGLDSLLGSLKGSPATPAAASSTCNCSGAATPAVATATVADGTKGSGASIWCLCKGGIWTQDPAFKGAAVKCPQLGKPCTATGAFARSFFGEESFAFASKSKSTKGKKSGTKTPTSTPTADTTATPAAAATTAASTGTDAQGNPCSCDSGSAATPADTTGNTSTNTKSNKVTTTKGKTTKGGTATAGAAYIMEDDYTYDYIPRASIAHAYVGNTNVIERRSGRAPMRLPIPNQYSLYQSDYPEMILSPTPNPIPRASTQRMTHYVSNLAY